MDVDAVLARRPQVALVDELAHSNVPGCRHEKRWQDVEELLEAGITVITTVNIQHLESLNDVVQEITGVAQRETVPDEVVRRADQIELVDMTPEALRRRMAHGNIYQPDKVDAALNNYFRVGNPPPCARWACCGWPTRSMISSTGTGPTTTSPTPGRRGSGSWSPSPVDRRATP
jgi:two-component system sensor histidine kinase KdpD